MAARTRWMIFLGSMLALVNIGGGMLLGPANLCFSLLAFLLLVLAAGFLQGKSHPAVKAVQAGGWAGAMLGMVNLISQSIGTVLFGLLVMGVMSLANQQSTLDLTGLTQGANLGVGVLGALLILKGLCFVAGGAGLGALAARIAMPRK